MVMMVEASVVSTRIRGVCQAEASEGSMPPAYSRAEEAGAAESALALADFEGLVAAITALAAAASFLLPFFFGIRTGFHDSLAGRTELGSYLECSALNVMVLAGRSGRRTFGPSLCGGARLHR